MKQKFEDLFDIAYSDDGRMVARTKRVYQSEDEDLTYEYRYVIDVEDLRRYDRGFEDNLWVSLWMMPTPEHFSEQTKKNLEQCIGCPLEDMNEVDFLDYGGIGVQIEESSSRLEEDFYNPEESEAVMQKVEEMVETLGFVDGWLGFFLDKPWNALGSTGWDTLRHSVNGEDLLLPAINRLSTKNV